VEEEERLGDGAPVLLGHLGPELVQRDAVRVVLVVHVLVAVERVGRVDDPVDQALIENTGGKPRVHDDM
jgi:hypothetical protein